MTQDRNHIEIKDLHFKFRARSIAKSIFRGIDFTIPKGKITAIMGPSGTGKTTLLRLIGRQLHPDRGQILVHGRDISHFSRKELLDFRKDMGLLFQSGALFSNLSVFENVAFPLREHTDLPESLLRQLVLMKLQIVGLRGARDLMPNQISGGMERRVALARAIALDPALIMYDEPFAGLDPISMAVITKLIRNINRALGMTTILVSHDVPEVAAIADLIYLISNGAMIARGTPTELNADDRPAVKQFIHGLPDGAVPFHYPAKNYNEDLLSEC